MGPNLGNDWQSIIGEEFEKPYYQALREKLALEYKTRVIYPDMNQIFAALKATPYEKVKVVILGQDPYHGENQAHGFSFSVQEGVEMPPSLVNIYKEIKDDLGEEAPKSGNLEHWASQGVLLLNAVLTVRAGVAASHQGLGWETFTDEVIRRLNEREKPMVFLLWGRFARSKKALLTNPKHLVLEAAHPSPLSAYHGFFGCKHFSKANDFLISQGMSPIQWGLPKAETAEEKPQKASSGSYYRVRAFISEKALSHNVQVLKEKIGPNVLWMAVIKSNAYGHGIHAVIPALLREHPDAFAVASLSEALQVREYLKELSRSGLVEGLSLDKALHFPILILGYTDASEYEEALQNDITITIFTLEQGRSLAEKAKEMGIRATVHMKLETGMQRIGFPICEETKASLKELSAREELFLEGAFTHFAKADEHDKSAAKAQLELMSRFLEELSSEGVSFPIWHLSNSASIMEYAPAYTLKPGWPAKRMMVRAGILLYGIYPSDEMDREATRLEPVLSLRSHIIHLKEVAEGTAIGYGGSYITEKTTRVATVPVGYGDGYPRLLSNQGYVTIRKKRARVLGRVCMDQIMVDVTDIPEASLLDEVILIGEDPSAEELAKLCMTIPYEIVCQLTDRVERVAAPPQS